MFAGETARCYHSVYGSCVVYQRLLYLCLSVYIQTVNDWFNKPIEVPSLKNETFLVMAERYLEENGSDPLERLIANKVKCVKESPFQTEMKPTGMQVREMVVPLDVEEIKLLEMNYSKQVQTDWACAVCQLTTTLELNLKSHLKGKELRANCEELKTCKQTAKSEGSPCVQLNQEQVKNEAAAGSENITTEKLKEMVHLAASGQQEMPKNLKYSDINSPLWCGTCNLWFPGEIAMAAHLSRTDHLAKLPTTMSPAAAAERSLKENGSDPLGKLSVNESKDCCLNYHAEEIKTTDTSDKAGMLTSGQKDSAEDVPFQEDINAMRHVAKHKAAGHKQVKRRNDNLIWVEKKTTGVQAKETSRPEQGKHDMNEESKEKVQLTFTGEHEKQKQVKNAGGATHNSELWCCFCNVRCSGDIDMTAHLNGRKHLANMQFYRGI